MVGPPLEELIELDLAVAIFVHGAQARVDLGLVELGVQRLQEGAENSLRSITPLPL